MIGSTERACLVIADITGYTEYLAGVELDHAQDILADLVTVVVTALRPTFRLAKLEGDAAFVYAVTERIDASILLDTIEGSYFAFRDRLLSIRQASTCTCNACVRMPDLDLKVVAHHGDVVVQEVAGSTELVGSDVVIVHRLLKNDIGGGAYAFFSADCVAAAGFDPVALGMEPHTEAYEHVGEVHGWVHRLGPAWEAYRERRVVHLDDEQAAASFSGFVAAPPEVVWEFISSPTLRAQWGVALDRVDQLDPTGRRRPGTMNHCVHGADVILQEFLDWRPPRYFSSRAGLPGGAAVLSTHEVEPVEGGVVVHDRYSPADEESAASFEALRQMFAAIYPAELESLRAAVAGARAAGGDGAPEPELPVADEQRRRATSVPASASR